MPIKTAEDQVAYLLATLKTCTEFKPDYHQLAADMDIANANNAQKSFKTIVEASGKYKLVNGKVVESFSIMKPAGSTTATNNATAAGAKVPQTPKKRKAAAGSSGDPADANNATPPAKRNRKKAPPAPTVEDDIDAED